MNSMFISIEKNNNKDMGIIIEGQAAAYLESKHCNLYSVGRLTNSYYSLAFRKGNNSKNFNVHLPM